MDWTIKVTDIAIVFATLLGPVLAVQAQKWLERQRAVNDRREQIFRALMATRATRLAPAHVEALNAIPVEFFGKSKPLKDIVESWRVYADHLDRKDMDQTLWFARSDDLFYDVVYKISLFLNYKFEKLQIQKEVYRPSGHVNIERDQDLIRRGMARLLAGELHLPMDVKSFPVDEDFRKEEVETRQLLRAWLEQQMKTAELEGSAERKNKSRELLG